MNNQELKDLRDKTIENTTDETTWGGTVKLEEIEEAGGKVRRRYVYRGDRYERQVTPIQRRRERYAGVLAALDRFIAPKGKR